MIDGTIAVIGRPNVGKSTLFNRLIKTRLSIVDDQPGVTRDRLYGKVEWLTKTYRIIDTGGIELTDRPFQDQIRAQAEIAMEEADVIVFLCDGRSGVTVDDSHIAKLLYRTTKPVILAVNKVDDGHLLDNLMEFYALGLGDPVAVSSLHGVGTGDLLDRISEEMPEKVKRKDIEGQISFSLIGRPNVGKSSLVNAILNQERVIVSNIEGTTRDAIDTPFKRDDREYIVIDTAGLKKRGKIYEAIDKYAALRALDAIDRSKVVLLVLDAETGIREQDKNIVSYAIDAGKAIIIVVNKWDTVIKDQNTMHKFKEKVRQEFQFLDYAPIVFVSAKNKERIHTIFSAIDVAYDASQTRVQTSVLNDILMDAQMRNPAPNFNGGRIKILYGSQVAVEPPTFVLFTNNENYMHFSYKRYIENRLRECFEFEGTPIRIICRTKTK
jgi:GTP-binding protein